MNSIEDLKKEKSAPVVIASEDGLVSYVNEPFETVFGYRKEEIIGMPLTVIIPKTFHDSHNLGFSRFLTTGKPTILNRTLVLKAAAKDGREFDAEHTIIAEKNQGRWVFGATIRPL